MFGKEHDVAGVEHTADYCATSAPESRHMQTQVGGDHYSKLAIQPGQYAMANDFNYWQSLALGYLTRYPDKGGRQDLEKLIDCIQKLIAHEYGE